MFHSMYASQIKLIWGAFKFDFARNVPRNMAISLDSRIKEAIAQKFVIAFRIIAPYVVSFRFGMFAPGPVTIIADASYP